MNLFNGLFTATMEPEKYLKRLNSYRNRIIIHTVILTVSQCLYIYFHVNALLSFSIAGLILLDELWRTKVITKLFKGIYNTGDVIEVDSSGYRTSRNDQAALFVIVVALLLNFIVGYAVAMYFMLFEGVRLAFATYKAKNVYGLQINQMMHYGIAFAFSLGAQLLRYLAQILF